MPTIEHARVWRPSDREYMIYENPEREDSSSALELQYAIGTMLYSLQIYSAQSKSEQPS
jgi:hypothetical protein